MQIDPLLLPLLEGLDLGDGSNIAAERAAGLESARAMVGVLTRAVPVDVDVRGIRIPGTDTGADIGAGSGAPDIPALVYTPPGSGPRGGLLFAHGGGWATGSPETAAEHCGTLAADADVVVVSVDYRLVPEHPYPAGLDDLTRALDWVVEHAAELGIDPARLAIGGQSAGGNLAAATALRRPGPLALQLLEEPVLDLTWPQTEARVEVERSFPPLAAMDRLVTRRYLDAGADPRNPLVSPLLAADRDLGGLPPAVLLAADVDPWRDDAVRYAERLVAAGIPARVRVFDGIVHGTDGFVELLPAARDWHAECVAALRRMAVGTEPEAAR